MRNAVSRAGGQYVARFELPPEYPMAAPKLFMMTPNGRYTVGACARHVFGRGSPVGPWACVSSCRRCLCMRACVPLAAQARSCVSPSPRDTTGAARLFGAVLGRTGTRLRRSVMHKGHAEGCVKALLPCVRRGAHPPGCLAARLARQSVYWLLGLLRGACVFALFVSSASRDTCRVRRWMPTWTLE